MGGHCIRKHHMHGHHGHGHHGHHDGLNGFARMIMRPFQLLAMSKGNPYQPERVLTPADDASTVSSVGVAHPASTPSSVAFQQRTSEDGQVKHRSWQSEDGTTRVEEKSGPGFYSKMQVFRSVGNTGSSNP